MANSIIINDENYIRIQSVKTKFNGAVQAISCNILTSHTIDYATVDDGGLNLLQDNINYNNPQAEDGIFGSLVASDGNGQWVDPLEVTIELQDPVIIDKGITIAQAFADKATDMLKVWLYTADNELISSTVLEFVGTTAYGGLTSNNEPVKNIKITNEQDSRSLQGYCQLYIDYIIMGTQYEVNEIVGDIAIYGDIATTYDDMPAVSCDFSAIIIGHIPESGNRIAINSDYYNGNFVISDVEELAKNYYSVKAVDASEGLSQKITTDFDIMSFSDFIVDPIIRKYNLAIDYTDTRIWACQPQGTTDRQQLVNVGFSVGKWFTGWKCNGLKETAENSTDIIIGSDRIIGEAKYVKKEKYGYGLLQANYGDKGSYNYQFVIDEDLARVNKSVYSISNPHAFNIADGPGAIVAPAELPVTAGIVKKYINCDEIEAEIIYNNENLGDIVDIVTKRNGTLRGLIYSIELTIGIKSALANIKVKVVG